MRLTYFTSSRNLSSSSGETWEYLSDRKEDEGEERELECAEQKRRTETRVTYFSWIPGRSRWFISAMMPLGSIALVFSSTQFSGSRSVSQSHPLAFRDSVSTGWHDSTWFCACVLTLVTDEAVRSKKLQGVDFKQHSVEEQVMSRRPRLSLWAHARLCKLLSKHTCEFLLVITNHVYHHKTRAHGMINYTSVWPVTLCVLKEESSAGHQNVSAAN